MSMTLTKKTVETQERIDAAGPDGALPLPKEQQEAQEKTDKLKDEIANLESMEGSDIDYGQ